jgi:glycosyltransferase involved in cell wall biosynthesis
MKVSVIIPCYNHWQYLSEALDSAIAQTYQNVEIIVVDDGSEKQPDGATIDLLEQKKIQIVKIDHSGPAVARNRGIEAASGDLILPLDADDKIAPTYLERAVTHFKEDSSIGIVYCDADFFGAQSGKWELPPYNFPDILLDNYIFASALFKKSDWQTVGGYNANMLHGWEDHDFWLSIIELKRTIFRIPETLFFYRKQNNSRTNKFTSEQKIEMFDCIVKNHRQLYAENVEYVAHRCSELKELLNSDTPEMELKKELQNLKDRIGQMESSGFWKLRNQWQSLRYSLGLGAKHKRD